MSDLSYTGPHLALYKDAMRIIPAAAAARLRGSESDTYTLYMGYLNDAKDMGVSTESAWSILAACGVLWTVELMKANARLEEVEVEDAIQRAIGAAADWVESGVV